MKRFFGKPAAAAKPAGLRLSIGRDAAGNPVDIDLSSPVHMALQGQTRSGKSVAAYGLISALCAATAATDCLDVYIIDPSKILGSPLSINPRARCVLGIDGENVMAVMNDLLARLDSRTDRLMKTGVDKLGEYTAEMPLTVLILEELPGIVEALQDEDLVRGRKTTERLAPRFISAVRRLLAEGLKTNLMVIALSQRFDASLLTGQARSNIGVRLCLRMDNADGVKMLLPGADEALEKFILAAGPGVGVIALPGGVMKRVKTDYVTYAGYVENLQNYWKPAARRGLLRGETP